MIDCEPVDDALVISPGEPTDEELDMRAAEWLCRADGAKEGARA